MVKTFIYSLIDPNTNEVRYVGKSNKPEKRLKGHIKDAELGIKTHKHDWIRSIHPLIPLLEIIEECDVKNWQEREQYWIKYYKEQGCDLTNLTSGGDGIVEPSIELKKRRSIIQKNRILMYGHPWTGRKHKKESRQLMCDHHPDMSGEKNNFYGKHHTNDAKRIIGEKNSGENNKFFGVRGKDHYLYGTHFTEEQSRNQSIAQRKRYEDPEQRRKTGEKSRLAWQRKKETNHDNNE